MNNFNKPGRPVKNIDQKRNNIIKISLTNDEYNFISYYSQQAGFKQLARFLRVVMFSMIKSGSFKYEQKDANFFQSMANFRNALNNLNQSVHRLNEAAQINILTRREVLDHIVLVNQVKLELQQCREIASRGVEHTINIGDHEVGTHDS